MPSSRQANGQYTLFVLCLIFISNLLSLNAHANTNSAPVFKLSNDLLMGTNPYPFETDKLTASDGEDYDEFGGSIAIDNGVIVIGATGDRDAGLNAGFSSGAVYVYTPTDVGGYTETRLTSSNSSLGDFFGFSVAIENDIIVVGAYHNDDNGFNSGSAYVYTRNGDGDYVETRLIINDIAALEEFGSSVAIDDGIVVVGAQRDGDNGQASGSVYVFTPDNSGGYTHVKLTASDGTRTDNFGSSVAIDNGKIVVGARFDDDNGTYSGSVYVYTLDSEGDYNETKLIANDGAAYDYFGNSVAVENGVVVVGVMQDDDNGEDAGSVYIYTPDETGDYSLSKLTASDGEDGDWFGETVSINNGTVAVGAPLDDDNGVTSGSVYVYTPDGLGGYVETKLKASDGVNFDRFGTAIAIENSTVLIGVPEDNDNGESSGSTYVFNFSDTLPDNLAADYLHSGNIQLPELVTGYDVDGDDLSYSLSGEDSDLFGVSNTGQLNFITIPDVDNPLDVNKDNRYQVSVTATDDELAAASLHYNIKVFDGAGVIDFETGKFNQRDFNLVSSSNANWTVSDSDPIFGGFSALAPLALNDSDSASFNFIENTEVGQIQFNFQVSSEGYADYLVFLIDEIEVMRWSGEVAVTQASFPIMSGQHSFTFAYEKDASVSDRSDIAQVDNIRFLLDADGDGIDDAVDPDDDNDGVPDEVEATQGTDPLDDADYIDTDGDGVPDYVEQQLGTNPAISDAVDSDGDGVSDYVEQYPGENDAPVFRLSNDVLLGTTRLPYQITKLMAIDGDSDDWFGRTVAIENDIIVVGTSWRDESIYIYRPNSAGVYTEFKLTASDGDFGDRFGRAIAIDNGTIVAGAIGSAYVFVPDGSGFTETKLTSRDVAENGSFGSRVEIDNGVVVVGAPWDDDNGANSGSAYVFTPNGAGGYTETKLTASDSAAHEEFGNSVAIRNGTVAVVASLDGITPSRLGPSSLYTYVPDGAGGYVETKLKASDGGGFGSIAISYDGTLFAGSPSNTVNGVKSGSVYIFEPSGAVSYTETKLTASDGDSYREFGRSVSVDDDTLIVGSSRDNDKGFRSGSAYVFTKDSEGKFIETKLTANDGATYDYFGYSVAFDNDTLVVGAYGDGRAPKNDSGSAYVYGLSDTLPNSFATDYSHPEHTQLPELVQGFDADGNDLSYSLSGSDSDLFTVSISGRLRFVTLPDFEYPSDTNQDNHYQVSVTVTDTMQTSSILNYTIIITDAVDPDFDGDGVSDAEDLDDDNDGYNDDVDAFPFDGSEWLDTDNDGIGDNTDLDDDNDGLSDEHEISIGSDPKSRDSDGDGYGDSYELGFGTSLTDANDVPVDSSFMYLLLMILEKNESVH